MKKRKIVFENLFHNTKAAIFAEPFHEGSRNVFVTESQIERASKKLCGMKDCKCGKINIPPFVFYKD